MEKSQIWGVGVGPLTWYSLWMSWLLRVQSSNSRSCKDRPSNECLLKMCLLFFLSTRPSVLRERETEKQKNGIHWPNRISVELFLESQCMFYFGQQCQIEKFAVFPFRSQLERKNPAMFGIHGKLFFLHHVCCVLCLGLTPAHYTDLRNSTSLIPTPFQLGPSAESRFTEIQPFPYELAPKWRVLIILCVF